MYKSQNSFASKSQTNFKTNRVTNIMKCNKLQSESRDLTRNNSSNRINIKSYDKNQTSKSQKKTFIKDKIINNNSNISKMKMKECNSQLKISGNQSSVVTQSINEYYKKSDKNYLNDKNNSKLDNNFNDIQFNRESDHISTSNLKEEFSFDKTNQTNSINDFLSGGESMIENNIFSPNRVTFYKKKRAGKMEITNNI